MDRSVATLELLLHYVESFSDLQTDVIYKLRIYLRGRGRDPEFVELDEHGLSSKLHCLLHKALELEVNGCVFICSFLNQLTHFAN